MPCFSTHLLVENRPIREVKCSNSRKWVFRAKTIKDRCQLNQSWEDLASPAPRWCAGASARDTASIHQLHKTLRKGGVEGAQGCPAERAGPASAQWPLQSWSAMRGSIPGGAENGNIRHEPYLLLGSSGALILFRVMEPCYQSGFSREPTGSPQVQKGRLAMGTGSHDGGGQELPSPAVWKPEAQHSWGVMGLSGTRCADVQGRRRTARPTEEAGFPSSPSYSIRPWWAFLTQSTDSNAHLLQNTLTDTPLLGTT